MTAKEVMNIIHRMVLKPNISNIRVEGTEYTEDKDIAYSLSLREQTSHQPKPTVIVPTPGIIGQSGFGYEIINHGGLGFPGLIITEPDHIIGFQPGVSNIIIISPNRPGETVTLDFAGVTFPTFAGVRSGSTQYAHLDISNLTFNGMYEVTGSYSLFGDVRNLTNCFIICDNFPNNLYTIVSRLHGRMRNCRLESKTSSNAPAKCINTIQPTAVIEDNNTFSCFER